MSETHDRGVVNDSLEQVRAHLRQDAILQQYCTHIRSTARPRNTEPWMAIGEQRQAALNVLSPACEFPLSSGGDASGAQRLRVADGILSAQPYLWSSTIHDLVRATPIPPHVIARDLMPHAAMFWSREVAAFATTSDGTTGDSNWMFLESGPTGITYLGDFTTSPQAQQIVGIGLQWGARYPDAFPEGLSRLVAGYVLASLAFLRSPFVTTESRGLPRQWRRHGLPPVAGAPLPDLQVSVVVLRRRALEAVEAEQRDRAIAWRHQWWVTGHYRAQWYPSTETHDVIWIAPHLKGPAEAPILNKVYSVSR